MFNDSSQDDLTHHNQYSTTSEIQIWRMRWFFAHLYAIALLTSILAGVIIAIITKNPLPGLIPTPLLLSMRPIVRWAFSQSTQEGQARPARHKTKKVRAKSDVQPDASPPSG